MVNITNGTDSSAKTPGLDHAADIAVVVIYFLFVLAVGLWVSSIVVCLFVFVFWCLFFVIFFKTRNNSRKALAL